MNIKRWANAEENIPGRNQDEDKCPLAGSTLASVRSQGPSVAEMPREEDKTSSQRPPGDTEFGFGSDESYWRGADKDTNPSFPYLFSTLAVV